MAVASAERFSYNLRRAREQKELSQADLGRLAGISKSEVYRLEAGTRDPRLTTVVALARALGVKGSDLIRGIH